MESTVDMDETLAVAIGRVATVLRAGRSGDGAAHLVVLLGSSIKAIREHDGTGVWDDTVERHKHVVRVDGHGSNGDTRELAGHSDGERGGLSTKVRRASLVDLGKSDILVAIEHITERFRVAVFGQNSQSVRGLSAKLVQTDTRVVDHDKEGREGLQEGQVGDGKRDMVAAALASELTPEHGVKSRIIRLLVLEINIVVVVVVVVVDVVVKVLLDGDDLSESIVGDIGRVDTLGRARVGQQRHRREEEEEGGEGDGGSTGHDYLLNPVLVG